MLFISSKLLSTSTYCGISSGPLQENILYRQGTNVHGYSHWAVASSSWAARLVLARCVLRTISSCRATPTSNRFFMRNTEVRVSCLFQITQRSTSITTFTWNNQSINQSINQPFNQHKVTELPRFSLNSTQLFVYYTDDKPQLQMTRKNNRISITIKMSITIGIQHPSDKVTRTCFTQSSSARIYCFTCSITVSVSGGDPVWVLGSWPPHFLAVGAHGPTVPCLIQRCPWLLSWSWCVLKDKTKVLGLGLGLEHKVLVNNRRHVVDCQYQS